MAALAVRKRTDGASMANHGTRAARTTLDGALTIGAFFGAVPLRARVDLARRARRAFEVATRGAVAHALCGL